MGNLRDTRSEQHTAELSNMQLSLKIFKEFVLSLVFKEFDHDDNGNISSTELLKLGQARRSTGQKAGVWTDEQNRNLIAKMDANGDGVIDQSEFVRHFSSSLPKETQGFQTIVQQFMDIARHVRYNEHSDSVPTPGKLTCASPEETAVMRQHNDVTSRAKQESRQDQSLIENKHDIKHTARELSPSRTSSRLLALSKVFKLFDLDGGGDIGEEELMLLGKARRAAGHRSGEWTDEQNKAMMKRMGMNRNGCVSEEAFVVYFDNTLPRDASQFEQAIQQFTEVAEICKQKKGKQTLHPSGKQHREEGRKAESSTVGKDSERERVASPLRAKDKQYDPLDAQFEQRWADTEQAAEKWTSKSKRVGSSKKSQDHLDQIRKEMQAASSRTTPSKPRSTKHL